MFARCLFCRRPFRESQAFGSAPPGRRIAFDPGRFRLWLVCEACHRWSLVPLDERGEALEALEAAAVDRSRVIYRTDHIALLELEDVSLVRVGTAGLREQAWWRYGRVLRRRRRKSRDASAHVTAATFGAVALLGESVGLVDHAPRLVWDDSPMTELLRWRLFGWAAWHGGLRCPGCGSILRSYPFDLTWWLRPALEGDRLVVGMPCPRCDPWTPDRVYRVYDLEAETLLRRALAYQHVRGASEDLILSAARAIEESGSAPAFTREAGTANLSLWSLGPARTLALEIALAEAAERRELREQAELMESAWRREEELAAIVDEELTPGPDPRRLGGGS